MSRLRGLRCYEAGAIDRAHDGGVGWRQEISNWLKQKGVIVFDPTCKPIDQAGENLSAMDKRRAWKTDGRWDLLQNHMRRIRTVDLRMVDIVDFLVVHIDLDVYACGTMEEIFWANRMKKPTLVVCHQGKSQIPDWLFGTLPHEHLFGSFEDLLSYLDYVDTAEDVSTIDRWLFFDTSALYNPTVLASLNASLT